MTDDGNKTAGQATQKQDWHAVNHEDLERRLSTGSAGLAETEAARRLAE